MNGDSYPLCLSTLERQLNAAGMTARAFPRFQGLIAALFFAAVAAACAPRPEGPALWRIRDEDSEIWLMGTVHVLPRDLHWRSARIDAAFDAADIVMFEADTEAQGQAAFDALVRREGALPEGETLSVRLTPKTRADLARVSQQLRLDPTQFEHTRPWLVALQISLAYALHTGGDPHAGVEAVLGQDARAAGKTLAYLEAPQDQIRTMASLSPAAETQFLAATLSQILNDNGDTARANRAWAEGDVALLASLLDKMTAEAGPETEAAIITARNRDWADKIDTLLDGDGKIFIAAGAAHLVGDENVVSLLRARGIEVEGP